MLALIIIIVLVIIISDKNRLIGDLRVKIKKLEKQVDILLKRIENERYEEKLSENQVISYKLINY